MISPNPPPRHVRRVAAASVGLTMVLSGLVFAGPALATSPGVDGEISYTHKPVGARSDIFAMNSNGTSKGNLTNTRRTVETTPAWSPSGGLLAFQALAAGQRRIFVLNASTGVVRRASSGPFADRFPTWSPNSRRIAYRSLRRFASGDDLGSADIYVVPRAGGAPVNLTASRPPGINTDPAWSPDGTKIAFASNSDGNYDIYVMDAADGANVMNLTQDDAAVPPKVSNRFPSWSPDGTTIAYTSNRGVQRNEDIYSISASGGPSTRLTTNAARDRSPAWSPSGSRIAFASNRGGTFNIWTMDAAPGEQGLAQLTAGTAKKTEPSWQSLAGCTIVGNNGANVLNGTAGADVICALGGSDTIRGGGGADLILGGPGNDVIRAGTGNDAIHAGRSNDTIFGAGGRDRLFGGDGRDTFFARDRTRDQLDGGRSRDRARIDRRLDQRRRIEAFF